VIRAAWGRVGLSDRDLAADFDNLIVRQVEIVRHMGGVALHEGEQLLLPAWQAPAVLAPGHRLVSHIVGHVGEIDGAAVLLELRQQARSIRPLHESVAHAGAPEARGLLRDGRALCVGNPGHRVDLRCDGENVLLQGAVVADLPSQQWRRVAHGSGEEHRGAWHAWNAVLLQLRHEGVDRDEVFVDARGDGGSTAMPDPHDQVHGAGERQRNVAALCYLQGVGDEEKLYR
jgi:hypothetical protein